MPKGLNHRRELEQQTAFEEAERLRAERRALAVFESFIDSSPVSIEIYDSEGSLVRSNKAAERLLGKVPPPGLSLFDVRGRKRVGVLEPQLKRVLAGTRVETPPTWYDPTEIGLPGVPGKKVCFRATVFPLFNNESEVVRIAVMHEVVNTAEAKAPKAQPSPAAPKAAVATSADVRELEFQRRKIEKSLREAEERYHALVNGAEGYVVMRSTEDGRVLAVSPSIEAIWGISAETVQTDQSAWFAQVHPDDLEQVKKTEAEIRETDKYPDRYRFRVINRNTKLTHWVEVKGSVSTAHGRKTCESFIHDVTHQLEVEHALARRENDSRVLLGSGEDGVVALDRQFVIQHWSKGAEAETRIEAQVAVHRPISEIYPDLETTGFLAAFKRSLETQAPTSHEAFYHDGREKFAGWFRMTSYPFDQGLLVLVRNMTLLRKAELAWHQADSRLRALLACTDLSVSLKDPELKYVLANPLACTMLGRKSESDLVGHKDEDFLKPNVAGMLASHDRKVLENEQPAEVEIALPDTVSPKAAWYRLVKTLFRSHTGDKAGVLTVGYDITARVFSKQELSRRRSAYEALLKEHSAILDRGRKELEHWQD
ncbi:MAG: PAS domain-containing protein [candidate division WOR-3 bacterium]|nr:MAG: PAS domain-containing protein [candidate division WOR-3 bacterium]